MEKEKESTARERFVPNPKLKLLDPAGVVACIWFGGWFLSESGRGRP